VSGKRRLTDWAACQESQGLSVDFFSSFFIVPSGDSVIRFSFFSIVPSLLTFSLSDSEIVRSQPIVSTESARADIIAINAVLRVFIVPRFNVAVFFSSRGLTKPRLYGGRSGFAVLAVNIVPHRQPDRRLQELSGGVVALVAARKKALARHVPRTQASVFKGFPAMTQLPPLQSAQKHY
jgi:hypothetical protein